MERIYRVVSLQRSGGKQYWEPVACSFLYENFPTNEYQNYTDALREYRNAISSIEGHYTFSVSLEERHKNGNAWHTLKERRFTEDDYSPLEASNELERIGNGMQVLLNRTEVIANLPKLSEETRKKVKSISKQLDSLIFLSIRLRYKVFEELKDGEGI